VTPQRNCSQAYRERRRRYFERLRLLTSAEGAQKAALDRAHDLRRFEIENYWRRATYFWGFQLVAFGALALTAKEGRVYPSLGIFVALLGALTAYAALLTARGSKFWQSNWEAHVDLLEDEVEGWLHKTVPIKKRRAPSVSGVNERLLQLLIAGWLAIFGACGGILLEPALINLSAASAAVLQVVAAAVALAGGGIWLSGTRLSGVLDRTVRSDDFEEWP
jgi:hypothetical protein